jgi:excisionase family DNA binding protein
MAIPTSDILAISRVVTQHMSAAFASISEEIERLEASRRVDARMFGEKPPQIDPSDVTLSIQRLPDLLTVKEAAQYARVAHRSIYALMERGELNYIRIGRLRRIPKTALAQIIDPNLKGGWKLRRGLR